MQDIEADDKAGRRVSSDLRNELKAAGKLYQWDGIKRPVQSSYDAGQVQIHCVKNPNWQKIRLSMKGIDTSAKLEVLEAWWDAMLTQARTAIDTATYRRVLNALETQVGNYLGALRRGGQLNDDNQIRKAR